MTRAKEIKTGLVKFNTFIQGIKPEIKGKKQLSGNRIFDVGRSKTYQGGRGAMQD